MGWTQELQELYLFLVFGLLVLQYFLYNLFCTLIDVRIPFFIQEFHCIFFLCLDILWIEAWKESDSLKIFIKLSKDLLKFLFSFSRISTLVLGSVNIYVLSHLTAICHVKISSHNSQETMLRLGMSSHFFKFIFKIWQFHQMKALNERISEWPHLAL